MNKQVIITILLAVATTKDHGSDRARALLLHTKCGWLRLSALF